MLAKLKDIPVDSKEHIVDNVSLIQHDIILIIKSDKIVYLFNIFYNEWHA